MQLKKLKKPIRYVLSRVLMIGVILTLGFLSSASVIAWCGLIGIGVMAFLLAGVIEGEVYAQGINEAWKKLFNRHHSRDVICLRTLDELLTKENRNKNAFLKEYHQLKKAIHEREERAKKIELTKAIFEADLERQVLAGLISEEEKNRKILAKEKSNTEAAKELKKLKHDLKLMQKYFQKFISGNIKNEKNGLENLNIDKDAILAEIQRKIWVSRGILVMSIIAGVGMGLVFLNVAPAGIVSFASLFGATLVAAALPQALVIVLFAFAVITAAGYMSLMYKALTGVLEKNLSIPAWLQNLRTYFQRREGETNTQFALRIGVTVLVGLIIVALGVFATITTAGTWWYAAQAGVTLIVPATAAITWAINIIIGITAFATLIFTLAYSLETMEKLSKLSSHFFEKKWGAFTDKIKAAWKNYNLLQVIIVVITETFKALAFIGHIIFTGLVGEGSNLLPDSLKGLTTAINSASDLLVDATAHMDIEDDCGDLEKKSSHEHKDDHSEHDKDPKPHRHSHAHSGHSHEHFDIPEWVCKHLLLPLYALSTLWDFFATPNPNKYESIGTLFGAWGNMLKKSWIKIFFGIEASTLPPESEKNHDAHQPPVLNESYRQTLSVLKIEKTLNNQQKLSELTDIEQTKFNELKTKLGNGEQVVIQDFFSPPSSSSDLGRHTARSDRAEKLCSQLEKINPAPLTPSL